MINFNFIKKNKLDTIKYIKNFEKYGVWNGRAYYIIFQKSTVWFKSTNSTKIRENHCLRHNENVKIALQPFLAK